MSSNKNSTPLCLYRIDEGEVALSDAKAARAEQFGKIGTPDNVVYALAASEAEALALADRYDRGEIGPDNAVIDGLAIVTLQQSQVRS